MPKALRNSSFTSFLRKHGLELWSVGYLSAEYRPGPPCLCLIISKMSTARPIRIAYGQSLGPLSGHVIVSTHQARDKLPAVPTWVGSLLASLI